jgi:hypothetical protein
MNPLSLFVSILLPLSAIAAPERPVCVVVDPPFNLEGTAIRLLRTDSGALIADVEKVFMWHGNVCNECIAGYPKEVETVAVVRNPVSTGAKYVGNRFELETANESEPDKISGDVAAILKDGTKVDGKLSPAVEFPTGTFCGALKPSKFN